MSSLSSRSVSRKNVAVIGAGAAGLVAAQILRRDGHHVQVFEKSDDVGGVWAYTDETDEQPNNGGVHSSMYKSLHTNIPTAVMQYKDVPFPSSVPSFPSHYDVQKYLQEYARTNRIDDLIRFNTVVEEVRLVNEGSDADPAIENDEGSHMGNKWEVHFRNSASPLHTRYHRVFDGIVVCNGHFFDPFYPTIAGIDHFQGQVMHAHNYRTPSESFRDKVVVVVGKGPSGQDISKELANIARTVYVSHPQKTAAKHAVPDHIILPTKEEAFVENPCVDKPLIECVLENGELAFTDGTHLHADVILLCTGYKYSYPFLPKGFISTSKQTEKDIDAYGSREGELVWPLDKHLFHVDHPSMSFIGLLFRAGLVSKVLLGDIQLPSKEQRQKEVELELEKLKENNLPARKFHELGHKQREYYKYLAELTSTDYPLPIQEMFEDCTLLRHHLPFHYRNAEYKYDRENAVWERRIEVNGKTYTAGSP